MVTRSTATPESLWATICSTAVDRIGLDFGERLHLCGPDATGGGIELRGQRGVAGL